MTRHVSSLQRYPLPSALHTFHVHKINGIAIVMLICSCTMHPLFHFARILGGAAILHECPTWCHGTHIVFLLVVVTMPLICGRDKGVVGLGG